MGSLTSILKDPLSSVLGAVGDIIGKFVASPDDKLKAQLELSQLSANFNLKLAELDTEWAKTQGDVIQTEAKSESWLTRSWRPLVMLDFALIITYSLFLAPLFSLKHVDLPPDMWELLKLGIGGYVVGRSLEKVARGAPAIVAAVKGGQQDAPAAVE